MVIASLIFFALTSATTPSNPSADPYKVIEQSQEVKSKVETQRAKRVEALAAFTTGKKFEEEGKFEEALKNYQKALEADPDYVPIRIAQAQVLFVLDRNKEGIALLEKIPQNDPEITSLLAWGYFKKEKKTERVSKLIDKTFELINNNPSQDAADYLRWGFRLALLFIKCQEIAAPEIAKKLLPIFEKAAELEPRNPQVQLLAAEISLHADNQEKALHYYEKVKSLAPNTPNIRQRLALFFALTDQKEKAINMIEEILQDKPDQKSLYPLLGELYERTGNFQKAEDNYLLALKLGSPVPANYLRLAMLYLRNKKPEKAIEILDEGAKNFPTIPHIPFLRAIALRDSEKYKEALETFSIAESAAANTKDFLNTDFYFEYGVTYEKTGKIDLAEKYLRKAIELDPKNHVAMNYLAYTWIDRNEKLTEAEKLLTLALQLSPEEAAYNDSLGWLYYRKGDYAKAEQYILAAAQKIPDDPEINEHLGDIYEKLNNFPKAQECWIKATVKASNPQQINRLKNKIQSFTP